MACVSVPGVLAPSLASSRRVARRVSGARAARVTSTVRAPSAPLGARRASPLARPRAARRAPRVSAASEEDLEKTLGASIDETFGDKAQAAFAKRTEETIDWRSIGKYFAATATQAAVMIYLTNWLSVGIVRSDFTPAIQKTIVGFWFLFNALRSRVFSPLNASRPKTSDEKTAIAERKRPSWMPPPLAFPVIWSSIALLRAFSSVAVFTVTGYAEPPRDLRDARAPLHRRHVELHQQRREKIGRRVRRAYRSCLLSVYNVVFQYLRVDRTAGFLNRPLRGVDKRRDRARVDDLEHQPEGGRDARAARADDETRVTMRTLQVVVACVCGDRLDARWMTDRLQL
jgi:tryptophan-rich sensory protein